MVTLLPHTTMECNSVLLSSLYLLYLLLPIPSGNCSSCPSGKLTGHHRRSVGPTGRRTITVDAAGTGEFLSIQAAIDSVPAYNTESVTIKISSGVYVEKVEVPATKPYLTFEGVGRHDTVVEWHDRACDRGPDGQQLRTYQTASVTVYADHFSARNISFKVW